MLALSFEEAGNEKGVESTRATAAGDAGVQPARESRAGSDDARSRGVESRRPGAGLHAGGNRRQDLHPQQGSQGAVGRARMVPEGVYRWLNGGMQLAP